MRKFFIFVIVAAVGIHFGYNFILSDKFEQYADRTKAPWTCHVENVFGFFHMMSSHYRPAYYRFSHASNRCPNTSMGETADFNLARCWEGLGSNRSAAAAYLDFIQKYPSSDRIRIAQRASDVLLGS